MSGWSDSGQAGPTADVDAAGKELDKILRRRMRSCRLIGELGVDGADFTGAENVVEQLSADEAEIRRFGSKYPALFSYYLVGTAARQGDGGELWPFVPFACDDSGCQRASGDAFEMACKVLDLETFTDVVRRQGGKRYIAPIMMHAMVPRQSVRKFLQLVLEKLEHGVVDPVEVISIWRNDHNQLDRLSVPAQRFIAGGAELAVDYVRRVVDLVHLISSDPSADGGRIGLPRYVAEEYRELAEAGTVSHSAHAGPRPRIELDPWSGSGPELILPATRQIDEWILVVDGNRTRIVGSDLRETQIPLAPGRSWRVDGRAGGATIARLAMDARPGGVLVFDVRTRELIRDDPVTSDQVVLIHNRVASVRACRRSNGGSVTVDLHESEECQDLFGDWGAYRVRLADLTGLEGVVVEQESAIADEHAPDIDQKLVRVFSVAASRPKPALIGRPTDGVSDSAGREVYDSVPVISIPSGSDAKSWGVVAKYGRKVVVDGFVGEQEPIAEGVWRLRSDLLNGPLAGLLELDVRGPIGSDLRAEFLVVSGLNIVRPDRVLDPYEDAVVAIAADPGVDLVGIQDGRVRVHPGDDMARVEVRASSSVAHLQIRVPRLVWAVSNEIAPEAFGAAVKSMEIREFLDHPPVLWARVGRGNEEVQLSLFDGEAMRQSTNWRRSGPQIGRVTISLEQFVDTIRVSDSPQLKFRLAVAGGPTANVAILAWRYNVSDLAVAYSTDSSVLDVLYLEERKVRGRRIAIWPLSTPWADPLVLVISDSVAPDDGFSLVVQDLHAGIHVCQVFAGPDVPLFPGRGAVGVASFEVVSSDVVGSPPPDEWPIVGDVERAGDDDEALTLVSRSLSIVTSSIDPPPDIKPDLGSIKTAVEVCFVRPALVYRALLTDVEERLRRSSSLRIQFVLKMLQTAVDCPPRTDLSVLEYGDLWEFSPLLGAAADHHGGTLTHGRWAMRTGWLPSKDLPFPGKCYSAAYADAQPKTLAEVRAKILASPSTLLGQGGFGIAMVDFLRSLPPGNDRAETLDRWRREHASVLRARKADFPSSVADVMKKIGWSDRLELRFPGEVFMAGVHLVCFGGKAEEARSALSDAAEFAPGMVGRQVLLALVHHLVDEDMIDLWVRGA